MALYATKLNPTLRMSVMKVKGFTLFELLWTSSLVILMASLALPGFTKLHHRSLVEQQVSALFLFIQLGRKESITRNKNIVLCGSSDGKTCQSSWSEGFILFIDNNHDDQFTDSIDEVLQVHKINSDRVSIEWNSFRSNRPIRFIPAGITWHNNGTFLISHKHYPELNKTITLAKSGRAEIHHE
jgi:type IV fimbrial biogenesis protein FimT